MKLNKPGVYKIAIIFLFCVFCYWGFGKIFSLSMEDILSSTTTYEYNPKTIIKDIGEGKQDLFTETETTIATNFIHKDLDLTIFSDQDFFQISKYIMLDRFNIETQKWNLIEVKYRYFDCPPTQNEDAVLGVFLYEKKAQNDGTDHIFCSNGITTYSNTVTFHISEKSSTDQMDILDLDGIVYSSSEIINIVKKTDIYKIKQEEADHCGYLSVTLDGNDPYWKVNYYAGNNADLLFSLDVDSITGEILIIDN